MYFTDLKNFPLYLFSICHSFRLNAMEIDDIVLLCLGDANEFKKKVFEASVAVEENKKEDVFEMQHVSGRKRRRSNQLAH